jgi:hypothetical protein
VLADSGWGDVDPRRDAVNIGFETGGSTSCCTVESQNWQRTFSRHFGFWDQQRTICPPLACASLGVSRTGSVTFKLTACGVEPSAEMLQNIKLGFVIGKHCSDGSLSLASVRRRGRMLIFP